MTKIDIFSGFLGAGKTTLIKKMIAECYSGQKLVLIENEFGQIGIDGAFMQEAGIAVTEMNSGCICCSLVGDFGKALEQVLEQYDPDRILIEPSGVGKLSDVIGAVQKVTGHHASLGYTVAVADASKVKVYMRNFGEFYNDQIGAASTIVLSRTAGMDQQKLDAAIALLRQQNPKATIVTTPWEQLTGQQLAEAMEGHASLEAELEKLQHEHHHHHHEEEHCCCGHHEEHHHHHHEEEHCCCGHHEEHHHHHHEEEHCCCGHHHDHHHADEVFTAWGVETAKSFTVEEIRTALQALDTEQYGQILRAKGVVACADGSWIHFDFVPQEINVRSGSADVTGKLCVIGAQLDEFGISKLFGV